MTSSAIDKGSLSNEALIQQNQALQEELQSLKAENQLAYALLVDTTRRLQASSTSIKAAVSSLLNYDILWDASNQHEFLETINISVDLLTQVVTLLALRFRVEAGELELKYEKQSMQEIISAVQVKLLKSNADQLLDVSFTNDGKLVVVDYGYLIASLELLIGAIASKTVGRSIRVNAEEKANNWLVSFIGLDADLALAVRLKKHLKINHADVPHVSSENMLKLFTALDLLSMQSIQVDLVGGPDGKQNLQLSVPVADN